MPPKKTTKPSKTEEDLWESIRKLEGRVTKASEDPLDPKHEQLLALRKTLKYVLS